MMRDPLVMPRYDCLTPKQHTRKKEAGVKKEASGTFFTALNSHERLKADLSMRHLHESRENGRFDYRVLYSQDGRNYDSHDYSHTRL